MISVKLLYGPGDGKLLEVPDNADVVLYAHDRIVHWYEPSAQQTPDGRRLWNMTNTTAEQTEAQDGTVVFLAHKPTVGWEVVQ